MTLYPMFKTKARLCEKTEFVKIYEMTVEGTEYKVKKSAVSDLHLHFIKRFIQRVCHLVDSVFICMGCSLGRNHAFAEEDVRGSADNSVYGSECLPWAFVWRVICAGAGTVIRTKL